MSMWEQVGQQFRRYVTLLNHACIILCLLCFPVASSQHVGGECLLPPGILPMRQLDPVPPPAHALQRNQRLRQSSRRGELRWVTASYLSPRGWRGHAEEQSQLASSRLMTLYECAMCVVCVSHFACFKMQQLSFCLPTWTSFCFYQLPVPQSAPLIF